jgi:glycosyltransferase 2 family protein
MKRWQIWVDAGFSALFLIIALRGLALEEVWQALIAANYLWLVPGVAAYFVGVWFRAWRWHYLLRPLKPLSSRQMWPIVVIGYMGNNVYPFRAGEVLRAFVLKRKEQVSMGASLATILVERIFDGLVMLLFVLLALPTVPNLPRWLHQTVIWSSIAFLAALFVFFLIAARPRLTERVYTPLIQSLLPVQFRPRLLSLAQRFVEGLGSLRSGRDTVMIFATSLVIWLLETIKYWFVMHAFPFAVSFFTLMLMNGVVNLATTLPSAPGYIGTFDAPGIEILKTFGVSPPLAASYTLVLHAALWLPITLLGLWYMARESLTWQDIQTAGALKQETAETETDPGAEVIAPPQTTQ